VLHARTLGIKARRRRIQSQCFTRDLARPRLTHWLASLQAVFTDHSLFGFADASRHADVAWDQAETTSRNG
jgi:hypothetical protein